MKKIFILFVILAILFIGDLYFLKFSNNSHIKPIFPTSSVTQTPINNLGFCNPSDLEANMSTEGAAGNIFGTLTIKNISKNNCQIIGSNFIQPSLNAVNLTVKDEAQTGPETFTLTPNQTVFSQIHYPNGPQCSSQVIQTNISYIYKISASETINFKNQNGSTNLTIGICQSPNENTELDVWSLSQKPVNQ